jgi:hypothetical protein
MSDENMADERIRYALIKTAEDGTKNIYLYLVCTNHGAGTLSLYQRLFDELKASFVTVQPGEVVCTRLQYGDQPEWAAIYHRLLHNSPAYKQILKTKEDSQIVWFNWIIVNDLKEVGINTE